MAVKSIETDNLEVAFQAALFGPREDRLKLLNLLRVANSKPAVTALVNVGNVTRGERTVAYDAIEAAIA